MVVQGLPVHLLLVVSTRRPDRRLTTLERDKKGGRKRRPSLACNCRRIACATNLGHANAAVELLWTTRNALEFLCAGLASVVLNSAICQFGQFDLFVVLTLFGLIASVPEDEHQQKSGRLRNKN